MGLRDTVSTLWSGKPDPTGSMPTVSMEQFLSDYDIVSVNDEPGMQFAVVSAKTDTVSYGEIGSVSPSPWTSFRRAEYNPDLIGVRGLEKYDRMRKSDGTVRGTLRTIKAPVLSGRWFMSPASNSDEDRKISDYIWWNLTQGLTVGWIQLLSEALLCADFGNYMFEKVWENREHHGEMMTQLVKLAPRHPMDVQEWLFNSKGGPLAVRMNGNGVNDISYTGLPYDEIPIEKLLVFTHDREAGNIEGISVLRTAYKHWYYMEQLYKIDAIQKERHGIGIPLIELPAGFSDADKKLADELGRNIRTNERAHIVLPPNWKMSMLKMEGQPVDALESIDVHQQAIREQLLVNFVIEGAKDSDLVMFMKASRIFAEITAESINQYLIPQMVRYNWPAKEDFPQLKVRRIGETADWRTLSFAIRNLIGAGVIVPDDALEDNLRDEMDLPARDPETARLIATPQNPFDANEEELNPDGTPKDPNDPQNVDDRVGTGGSDQVHNKNNPAYNRKASARRMARLGKQQGARAGLPRQTPVAGRGLQRQGPFGVPRSNGGRDGGGK